MIFKSLMFWIWSKMRSKLLNFNLEIGLFCFVAAIVPVSRLVIPHQAGQWRSAPPYRFPLRKSSTPGRNRKRDYATANRTAHLFSHSYIFFPSVLRNNSKQELFPFHSVVDANHRWSTCPPRRRVRPVQRPAPPTTPAVVVRVRAGCTRTKPKSSRSSRSSRTVSRTTRGRISPRSPFTVARLPYPRWTGARRMATRLMGFRRAGEWGGMAAGTRWDRRPHRPAAAAVEGDPTRILGPSAVWCLPVFAALLRANSVSGIWSFSCTYFLSKKEGKNFIKIRMFIGGHKNNLVFDEQSWVRRTILGLTNNLGFDRCGTVSSRYVESL